MKKLRLGMIGGGQGAFIGAVHRIASRIDDQWSLEAGCLSSKPERAIASAKEIGLPFDRSYISFQEMAEAEKMRDDGIHAVAIVTPNNVHADPAITFLKAGIHVICDKPLASSIEEAKSIEDTLNKSGKLLMITHNYTGYPLIRQAKEMVEQGELGKIRVIQVEYAQDWLTSKADNKQANWRTDPNQSGGGGCIGDIGTHAYNLINFVTGIKAKSLSAELSSFVDGRLVDDNAHVFLRYENGARGILWASQVAVGNENNLRLRIFGEKAGIEWSQENPNQMSFTKFECPKTILTRSGAGSTKSGLRISRIPAGHPEGYLEAFATLYSEAAHLVRNSNYGISLPEGIDVPDINAGLDGMRFINACIISSKSDAKWTSLT
jgi:predicted dehydrogenase|tara:strand:+ start:1313 stop:2446 length:1134 start_codon:yes stop_codon:yes gene_type:complete